MSRCIRYRAVTCCLSLIALNAAAQEYNGQFPRAPEERTDQIIVKWRGSTEASSQAQKLTQLASRTRMKLQRLERISNDTEVLKLDRALSGSELSRTIDQLSSDSSVEYASPDLRRHAHALPDDTLVADQWYFLSTEISALRADAAWDATTGSKGTVIAVLDTGVRYDHPDLLKADENGKLLPGYDFVSGESQTSFIAANDGDGRDANPSDPGDWVDSEDLSRPGFENCETRSSSWHGTRVAGVIAARTNNSAGIAGAAWNAWILPARVLGKCGGRDSDIIAAMRWAAGLAVPGVPANPYPAKIINLSLGGGASCSSAYRDVVAQLTARGVLIVASAGNEGGAVSAPANCPGVLAVAGVRQAGTKVGFSNLGTEVGIAAPGGNCVNTGFGQPCLFSIITTTNLGEKTPGGSGYTDQFNFNVGTSFSAPLVSGAAALMHSVNAKLGAEHLIARLQQGAMPFPVNPNDGTPTCQNPATAPALQDSECYCTTETCGAGLLSASGAVTHALRPAVAVSLPSNVAAGQDVTFDASASAAACNRTIVSYEWAVVEADQPPALTVTNQPSITVQAPAFGQYTLRVTVTDNVGAQDFADVIVTSSDARTTALPIMSGAACPTPITVAPFSIDPPSSDPPASDPPPQTNPNPPNLGGGSGGGGGGGQLGWELLALLFLLRRRGVAQEGRRDSRKGAKRAKEDTGS